MVFLHFILRGVLWDSAQTPSLCCCHCYLPQGVGRVKSRSCGGDLPNTALGRFLASSIGVAPQRLLSQLLSRGCTLSETGPWPWGCFFGRSCPPDLLFLCSEEFALPLTGRLSRIPVPANNSVYCTFSAQNTMRTVTNRDHLGASGTEIKSDANNPDSQRIKD